MASDNHASYGKIGFTVFMGVVAIIGSLIYLGGLRGRSDEVLVETYYDKAVSGLSVGSAVNFRGVKIGEVREISFIGSHYDAKGADKSRIYVLMALNIKLIDEKCTVESIEANLRRAVKFNNMRATVTVNGITGLSRIEIDHSAAPAAPPPEISWTPAHVCIPPKDSLLDSFSVAATKVMNQINSMDLKTAWSNVSTVVESAAQLTDGVRTMLDARQAEIDRILRNLAETSESARELVSEIRQNPSVLIRGVSNPELPETAR